MRKYKNKIISNLIAAVIILSLAFESYSYSNLAIKTSIDPPTPILQPLAKQCVNEVTASDDYSKYTPSNLYAQYAAVIDGSNCRVLFEKNGYEIAANASTTKIMTLIIALEYGNVEQITTVSKYAATMPDVQLNINSGEHYVLNDLLYALMLKSYNDCAVAIAENVALSYLKKLQVEDIATLNLMNENSLLNFDPEIDFNTLDLANLTIEQSKELEHIFASLMNLKATSLGCTNTHFITANGLDAVDEVGKHATTAVDLAKIMAYCIQNENFLKITQANSHTLSNKVKNSNEEYATGTRSFSFGNANAFLNMMDGVISGKTGFTGDAGYCYVCALRREDKTFVSVVLASGWPGNKTYKWVDTKKLLNFGLENYINKNIFTDISDYKDIVVKNGITPFVKTCINSDISMLISRFDNVNIVYSLPEIVNAPITSNSIVGTATIYINDQLYCELPILTKSSSEKIDFKYCMNQILEVFLP